MRKKAKHFLLIILLFAVIFYSIIVGHKVFLGIAGMVKLKKGTYWRLKNGKKHYYWRKNPYYYPLKRISHYLIDCVITSEDDEFYSHHGINIKKMWEAFNDNLKAKRIKRGGSTITQQVVKNLFLTMDRTITRKVEEVILAVIMEFMFTKDEILEIYLNEIQWGPNIFGIKKASYYYFSKPPSKLTLIESAFLAFIIPAPAKRYIFKRRRLRPYARRIIKSILLRTYVRGKITKKELNRALYFLKRL